MCSSDLTIVEVPFNNSNTEEAEKEEEDALDDAETLVNQNNEDDDTVTSGDDIVETVNDKDELELENSFDSVFDDTINTETTEDTSYDDLVLPDELEIDETTSDQEPIPDTPQEDNSEIAEDEFVMTEPTTEDSADDTISDNEFVMPDNTEANLNDFDLPEEDWATEQPDESFFNEDDVTLSDEAFVKPEDSFEIRNDSEIADDDFVVPEPAVEDSTDNTISDEFVPPVNDDFDNTDFYNEEASYSEEDFSIPDTDSTQTHEELSDQTYSLPTDDDFMVSETTSLPSTSNYEDDEEPFSFDSLPDFNDLSDPAHVSDSNDFEMPNFDDEPQYTATSNDDFSMGGAFDGKDVVEENVKEEEHRQRKTILPVVICIICAIICVLALLAIIFIFPWNSKDTAGDEIAIVESTSITVLEPETPPVEPIKPEAPKENTMIVTQEPVEPIIPPAPVETTPPESIHYLIRWGDTLWNLAETYYKNPWMYPKIAKANNIKNPNLIIAGTYINIPPK